MSIFDSTTTDQSPDLGQEEVVAEVETAEEPHEEQEQETEFTEHEEEAPPDETGQVDLILGKFKSTEDLATAYQNLQREFTKSRQQPRQETQHQITTEENDPAEVFWQAFQRDPLSAVNYLVQEAQKPFEEQRETETLTKGFDSVTKQYGSHFKSEEDVTNYFAKVQEIAAEFGNPKLVRNPSPRILKMAAEELFGTNTAAIYQQAKQAGRQEAEQARQAKTGIGVQTSKKPPETPKTEEQLIKESILNAGVRNGIFG